MSTPEYDELEPQFGELMALLREGREALPEVPTERPSEAVWNSVAAELGLAAGESDAEGIGAAEPADAGASVRSISSARSARRTWGRPVAMLTAAAAVLLVAVPLYLAFGQGGGVDLRADLQALSGFDGTGSAEVDGSQLTVRFDGSEAPDSAFYELWLLDVENDDVQDLRSLGRIEVAADGSFELPDDIDLDEFNVVDISVEPDDGNPDHSGASVLRGPLSST